MAFDHINKKKNSEGAEKILNKMPKSMQRFFPLITEIRKKSFHKKGSQLSPKSRPICMHIRSNVDENSVM